MMILKETETFIEHDIIFDGIKVGELELCPTLHEISRLVIFEPYQNKGYGTKVVRELISKGYTKLWVRSDNPKAIHVYERCGFKFGENVMHEMVYEEPNEVERYECRSCVNDNTLECLRCCGKNRYKEGGV